MNGRVVQGLRGERQEYRAVRSELVAGCDPLSIARALSRECCTKALYVADLDAIAGTGDHRDVVLELRDRLGAEPWVDAGVSDEATASRLREAGASRVIIGTETLPDLGALRTLRKSLAGDQMLVSVDVGRHGVLSRCPALAGCTPLAALELLAEQEVTDVVLLALLQVGTGAGPDLETLRTARGVFPGMRLIAGGGVRSSADLRALADAGADGVLLATALHRRWITAADILALRADGGRVTSEP
jgi:phosphoribosylformimino-5-aminoimidazole carboxamide ribotide isomerase